MQSNIQILKKQSMEISKKLQEEQKFEVLESRNNRHGSNFKNVRIKKIFGYKKSHDGMNYHEITYRKFEKMIENGRKKICDFSEEQNSIDKDNNETFCNKLTATEVKKKTNFSA